MRQSVQVQASSQIDDVVSDLKKAIAADIVGVVQAKFDFEATCLSKGVEKLHAQLEVFKNLIEMIQIDSRLCQQVLLPQLSASFESLTPLFERIDHLEAIVQIIKENVNLLEKEVGVAEASLSPVNPLKKLFGPLFTTVREATITQSGHGFTAPKIFDTDELFSQSQNK